VRDTSGADLERVVAGLVDRLERRYFGKYRGFVVDDADPLGLARLRVRVPSVLGPDVVTGWASACVPYGGADDQGLLFLPDRDAGVWVEFEEGDLEFPIWTGTFWSKPDSGSQVPRPNDSDGAEADEVQDPITRKIVKTAKGHTLQFEDADGDESILVVDGVNGHVLVLDSAGITVTDGVNGHEMVLDSSGITLTDGKNSGNQVVLNSSGLTLTDSNHNTITMGASGITLGSGAVQSMVLGDALKLAVTTFVTTLNTHTHIGNLGAPTSPPMVPMQLDVQVSSKHKVE
jgi:hypothetical protein